MATRAGPGKRLLAETLKLAPRCHQAQMLQAEWLFQDASYGGVISHCGKILKIDATHVGALLLRGRAYLELGDLSLAKKHFLEAVRSDPEHADARLELKFLKALLAHKQQAEKAYQNQNYREAETHYSRALRLSDLPRIVVAALWLEFCKVQLKLEGSGNTTYVVNVCRSAADQNPESEEAAIGKVRALTLDKQHDAAVREAGTAKSTFYSQNVHEALIDAVKAQKLAERKQYYEILNITKQASDTDIRRAYRVLARKLHPDKAAQEGIPPEKAQEQFMEVSEAYGVLSDPQKRADYDDGKDLEIPGQPRHNPFQTFQFPSGFSFSDTESFTSEGKQYYYFKFGR